MPLTRVDIAEAERGRRIARQAAALDASCTRWTWQISQLAKLLPLFRSRRIRRGVWRWIRGYLHDYRKANWRTGEQEIDVAQAIDFDIPFDKTALADYLSVIMI